MTTGFVTVHVREAVQIRATAGGRGPVDDRATVDDRTAVRARKGAGASTGTVRAPYAAGPVPGLSLTVTTPSRRYVLSARPGPAGSWAPALDEHVVLDADTCAARRRPACADVVAGSRARPVAEAAHWLEGVLRRHHGAALAAVPVTGGGWAVAGAADRRVTVLARHVPPEYGLFPSCLHAWLVAGGTLRGLGGAVIVAGPLTAGTVPSPVLPSPDLPAARPCPGDVPGGGRRRCW